MSNAHFVAAAAAAMHEILGNIKPDQLEAPTPCAGRDVRAMVNHLLFWGPSLEGSARKEAVPPPAEDEADVDLTGDDWAADLAAQLDRITAAWSSPGAWDGLTQMGAPMDLPAPLIGGMVVGELVVHGWDLARATGQHPEWDEDLLQYLLVEVAATAEQGRELGVYGPEVPVPEAAATIDRVLGLTGRDPRHG